MLSAALGWLLYQVTPGPVRSACLNDFFAGQKPTGWIWNLLRKEIVRRYRALSDSEKRRLNRTLFWGGKPGVHWHQLKKEQYSDPQKFQTEFLRFREPLVRQIENLISVFPEYRTICHIGTGHGLLLNYIHQQLPGLRRHVGLDICEEQIEINRRAYAGKGLEFVHGEVLEWLASQPDKRGIIFVAVGTFQYFTPPELQEFMQTVRQQSSPAAIALSESVNMRLTSATEAQPRGDIGYSHPYMEIFRRERYFLFQHHLESIDGKTPFFNQLVLTATTVPVRQPAAVTVP